MCGSINFDCKNCCGYLILPQQYFIVHETIVEDRSGLSLDDIKDCDDVFIKIRHRADHMWGGLVRISATTVPLSGTLAALCGVNSYLD